MDDQQYVLKKVKMQMIMHMNKNIMSQININMREGGVDSYNNVDETNEYDPNENIVNPEVPE